MPVIRILTLTSWPWPWFNPYRRLIGPMFSVDTKLLLISFLAMLNRLPSDIVHGVNGGRAENAELETRERIGYGKPIKPKPPRQSAISSHAVWCRAAFSSSAFFDHVFLTARVSSLAFSVPLSIQQKLFSVFLAFYLWNLLPQYTACFASLSSLIIYAHEVLMPPQRSFLNNKGPTFAVSSAPWPPHFGLHPPKRYSASVV